MTSKNKDKKNTSVTWREKMDYYDSVIELRRESFLKQYKNKDWWGNTR